MPHIWFEKEHPTRRGEIAPCGCPHCELGTLVDTTQLYEPYCQAGLDLSHGTRITLATVKEAIKIIMDHLQEIHQPYRLETLCRKVVIVNKDITASVEDLPLPKLIIEQLCEEETAGNFARVEEWSKGPKMGYGLLWRHLGCTIVRQ